jgi:poly(3-hydroxybutyrate) depolymerase
MKSKILFLIILLAFGINAVAFTGTATITSAGITRSFVYHFLGTNPTPVVNLPVMFVLHGDGGSGSGIQAYAGFDAVADAQGFIAVYPNAISSTWNRYADNVAGDAGLGNPSAADDVLFISDVINFLCTNFSINSKKVYATGHSAGGFMAYNLAVQLSNKIAAIAPVSASLWGNNTFLVNYFTTNYTSIPIYHVHGDADATVSYPDANNAPNSWGEWPLSDFANSNCGNNTYITTNTIVTGVKKLVFCSAGKQINLIDIVGGGHGWPNAVGYNAALSIWNFCNTYSINTTSSCVTSGININNLTTQNITIYPSPSTGGFMVSDNIEVKNITVSNILGETLEINTIDKYKYLISKPVKGIYFLTITDYNNNKIIKRILIE